MSARALGIARMLLGAVALLKLCLFLPDLIRLAGEPVPLPVVPLPAVPWLLVASVWAVAALLVVFGIAVHFSGGLLALCGWYCLLLDERTYSNHLLLITLLVTFLAASGGGRVLGRAGRVPGAAVLLMLTQLSAMYLFAGLAKANGSFLIGEVLLLQIGVDSAILPLPLDLLPLPVLVAIALGAVVFETALAVALWFAPTRPYAFAGGAALHTVFILTMRSPLELLCFGVAAVAVYPLFASWRPGGSDVRGSAAPASSGPSPMASDLH
ncbi:HTTM domain-containing protein [Nocardiopsis sediminis]|uniref:HTTM domain-containing protein n=1 Tax=Nocardiopsis sediminis TaxID=1778267 RepID=A0ABV8FK89_9ACTN